MADSATLITTASHRSATADRSIAPRRRALDRSVDRVQTVTTATESIEDFFARYTGHLTAGDIEGLAAAYNYPSLAVTAMGCLAITEPQQSRDFFGQGQHFYRSRGFRPYARPTS